MRWSCPFKLFLIWYVGLYTVIYTRIYINLFRTCTVNSYPWHASVPMHHTREYSCAHTLDFPSLGRIQSWRLESKSCDNIYAREFACIQTLYTRVLKLIFWVLYSDFADHQFNSKVSRFYWVEERNRKKSGIENTDWKRNGGSIVC